MDINKKIEIEFYKTIDNYQSFKTYPLLKKLPTTENIDLETCPDTITERKIIGLQFVNGKYEQYFTTNIKGEPMAPKLLNDKELEYLEDRLNQTKNIYLKSKYSHIAWQLKKHNKYAEIAINSYIEIINSGDDDSFEVCVYSLLHIIEKTSVLKKETKEYLLKLFGSLPTHKKIFLFNLFIEFTPFKTIELKTILEDLPNWFSNNPIQYFNNKSFLELGIKLYPQIGLKTDLLYKLLAENEDFIIQQHSDEKDFVYLNSLGEKAKYLKKGNFIEQYNQTLKLYTQAKSSIKLNKVSVEGDKELNDLFDRYVKYCSKEILNHKPDEIFGFFSISEDILEDVNKMDLSAYKSSLQHLYTTIALDINSNTKTLSEEQKLFNHKLESYSLSIILKFYAVFYLVFYDGIRCGKISYNHIIDYFKEYTWFNLKFDRKFTDNKIEKNSNWVSLIAPGIYDFINQFQNYALYDDGEKGKYILAIDSLTLKFEGALRDFIRLSGGNTTIYKNNNLQEQTLEELLENEITKKLFTSKEIELFTFTFTKHGRNIRNNVAHSFMKYSDYSLQTISIIFLCFLRLGKFEFKQG